MRLDRRQAFTLGAVVLLGAVALLQHALADLRPPPLEMRAATRLAVLSGADHGPGTLREAILEADRATEAVRIVIQVPAVVLDAALPPLINPHGVIVEALPGRGVIDGRSVAGDGPLLLVASPGSVLRGLTLTGARGPCLRVDAAGVRLSEMRWIACREGVIAGPGAAGLELTDSDLVRNRIGLVIDPSGPSVTVVGNRFREHEEAAIWGVAPELTAQRGGAARIAVRGNRFSEDRQALVLGGVSALVTDNDVLAAGEAGIYVLGSGVELRGNRIRDGRRFGIYAAAAEGTRITGNELSGNRQVALMLNATRRTQVSANQVYENGYGLVSVFASGESADLVRGNLFTRQLNDGIWVAGGSPVIQDNQVTGNREAGLRILDYLALDGERRAAEPLVDANRIEGNGVDRPALGVYRQQREDAG